jgi:ABC-type amino acid transport system permease subunit
LSFLNYSPSLSFMIDPKNTATLHRAVRLTARTSALLFAASQASQAMGSGAAHAWRPLYAGFMAAHAAHFAVVIRYAKATGGRALFPGGRNLTDVGGWPTVAGIYTFFAGLAATGWAAGTLAATTTPGVGVAGRIATVIMGAMFVGTYLGQLPRSGWNAVPAAMVSAAIAANLRTGFHPSDGSARWVADPTRINAAAP